MNPFQNPTALRRLQLLRRTVAVPVVGLCLVVTFIVLGRQFTDLMPSAGAATRKARELLTGVLTLQGAVAILGPTFAAAFFGAYDQRSVDANATQTRSQSRRSEFWGELVGIAAAPLAIGGYFGLIAIGSLIHGPLRVFPQVAAALLVFVVLTLVMSAIFAWLASRNR